MTQIVCMSGGRVSDETSTVRITNEVMEVDFMNVAISVIIWLLFRSSSYILTGGST